MFSGSFNRTYQRSLVRVKASGNSLPNMRHISPRAHVKFGLHNADDSYRNGFFSRSMHSRRRVRARLRESVVASFVATRGMPVSLKALPAVCEFSAAPQAMLLHFEEVFPFTMISSNSRAADAAPA